MFNRIKCFFKKKSVYTSEVFKNNGVPEFTLIKRRNIEEKLNEVVNLRNKVILFLGYSKSGKTVYRKIYFQSKNIQTIVFRCNKNSSCIDFYRYICQEANIPMKNEMNNSSENTVETEATIGIPDTATNGIKTLTKSINGKTFLYPETKVDVNHICNHLAGKKNICIVIEDYHLLNDEFSKILSEDIKHFLDDEILFVIIGIPSSPGRTFRNNPDLGGRTVNVLFDYLLDSEIEEILDKGEEKLNIQITHEVRDEIIRYSMRNVYLVQSIAQVLVKNRGITKTSSSKIIFSDPHDVQKACQSLHDDLLNDYKDIINSIMGGSRKQSKTKAYNQYEEILRAIKDFSIDELEKGLSYADIGRNSWKKMNPELIKEYITKKVYKDEVSFRASLNSQISAALTKLKDNFTKTNSREVIIYYDNKLFLMDIVFKFFLTWDDDFISKS
jgi:hypothetical protein